MTMCAGCEHERSEHAPGLGCVWEDADGWLCMCHEWEEPKS